MLKRLLSLAMLGIVLTAAPAVAQQSSDLPSTKGQHVVDRLLLEVEAPNGTAYFYAVLHTEGDQSFLDVYKGLPFQRIHRWALDLQGDKVKVGPDAVLMALPGEDDTISFWWREFVGYREGAVSMALTYHRKTGKFTTAWSD